MSIMTANNETGTLQPVREISRVCRERGVLFHSDTIQSFGKNRSMSPATSTRSARAQVSRTQGRRLLFLRAGISIERLQHGGSHENERRPGTRTSRHRRHGRGGRMAIARSRCRARAPGRAARPAVEKDYSRVSERGETAIPHTDSRTRSTSASSASTAKPADEPRPGRHLRVERLGVHGRVSESFACFACDGSADGTRPFRHPSLTWQMDNCERNRRC